MKKMVLFIVLSIVISVLLLFLIGCQNATITTDIDAEVLSINSHILNGELWGSFLSSSSGSITDDIIKIGIKLEIGEYLFLEDLQLRHAELAYYKNSSTIPLKITCEAGFPSSKNCLKIYLNGNCKRNVLLTHNLAENVFKILQESNNQCWIKSGI